MNVQYNSQTAKFMAIIAAIIVIGILIYYLYKFLSTNHVVVL